MDRLSTIYRTGLGLLTDLYQLTMAYGYWKQHRADQQAVFHLFFRQPPFGGRFAVAAGLGDVAELIGAFRFDDADLAYLSTLEGNDGRPLFDKPFLAYLGQLQLTCDIDAVPEGTVVFALEPLVRVCGPILQGQILESALLNLVNFQTLVATKAARICAATGGDPVLKFGLRRAQGIDGSLAASRAAYIGGCAATSNVLAGKLMGIPVKGTHAHSWVMSFDSEPDAFASYAQVMPNNCVFLVDTYDTLAGVRHAIDVGLELRRRGHEMVGIRLDSGDLAQLSIKARRMLDEAGLGRAAIVASNDLDEQIIQDLKRQGATISVWGVGTKLVTAFDQPALGGVYKLGAIRDETGSWQHRVKVSEQPLKTTIPGMLQVRRFHDGHGPGGDMIYDLIRGHGDARLFIDTRDPARRHEVDPDADGHDLLVAIARGGQVVAEAEPLAEVRARAMGQAAQLSPATCRLLNPEPYPVGLEPELHALRMRMIDQAKRQPGPTAHSRATP